METKISYELYNNGKQWRVMRFKYVLTSDGWLKFSVRCLKICDTRQEAQERVKQLEKNDGTNSSGQG